MEKNQLWLRDSLNYYRTNSTWNILSYAVVEYGGSHAWDHAAVNVAATPAASDAGAEAAASDAASPHVFTRPRPRRPQSPGPSAARGRGNTGKELPEQVLTYGFYHDRTRHGAGIDLVMAPLGKPSRPANGGRHSAGGLGPLEIGRASCRERVCHRV